MKSYNHIEKKLGQISEDDRRNLLALLGEIESILEKKQITEDTVRKLDNIENTVSTLKDNYMWRLIRAAKQNHMLE